MGVEQLYPIVQYAHKIGKNTADLTTVDMVNYMKWWMKQPVRPEVEKAIKQQLKRATQIHNEIQSYKKEDKIMVKRNIGKFQAAQHSRLTSDQVVDIEQVDEDIAAAMEEEGEEGIITEEELDGQEVELQKINDIIAKNDIVCSLELTKLDVEALLFSIARTFADYEMNEDHEYTASLLSVKEGLEGV